MAPNPNHSFPTAVAHVENPYLAHLETQEGLTPSSSVQLQARKNLRPGTTTDGQQRVLEEGPVSIFNNRPFSTGYYDVLETRRQLPVYRHREAFLKLIHDNQIIVLEGETGSGKTTQIPQFFLYDDLPHQRGKLVGCTQPRRVAAMSVAKRVAEEMDVKVGQEVGYSIRFEDCVGSRTILKYMTDGMLLREAMNDANLSRYSCIILDEAHERTLSTDILMGLLKEIAARRKDLKLIIMSATLDAKKFQKYFGNAPLLSIPGRTYPVDILYSSSAESDYLQAAIRTAIQIHETEDEGDILLFLTGEEEIEDACRRIQKEADSLMERSSRIPALQAIPLYSTLPPHLQQRIFDPPPAPRSPGGPIGRKCIVATNIAETSITIDGIVYVVDPGFSKQKTFHPRLKMESLLVAAISQAAAQQRAGRAGRTKPGKCFRLYTETAFEDLDKQTPPEMQRSNLGNVVLQMMKVGIRDLVRFDFMDPPAPETMMRSLESLFYLGAMETGIDGVRLSRIGNMMAEFPVEPEQARCLIASPEYECSEEMLSIISMLAVPLVFQRPPTARHEADARHEEFHNPDSDHITLLNIYHAYERAGGSHEWCRANFLNPRALRSAQNVRRQLTRIMERIHLPLISPRYEDEALYYLKIRRALSSGFFGHCARRRQGQTFLTGRENQVVRMHKNSSVTNGSPWVVYNEIVLTSREFMRTVTAVELEWLYDASPEHFALKNFEGNEVAKADIQRLVQGRELAAKMRARRAETNVSEYRGGVAVPGPATAATGRCTSATHQRGRGPGAFMLASSQAARGDYEYSENDVLAAPPYRPTAAQSRGSARRGYRY